MKFAIHILILPLLSMLFLNCSSKKQSTDKNLAVSYQSCIDHIIAVDDSIGKIRNHNCEKISLSETIKVYTTGIENLDFNNCPGDFTNAFQRHKKAWTQMLQVTDKHPNLRGEMHDLFKILEEGKDKEFFKPLLDKIWSTWAEVEKSMAINKE